MFPVGSFYNFIQGGIFSLQLAESEEAAISNALKISKERKCEVVTFKVVASTGGQEARCKQVLQEVQQLMEAGAREEAVNLMLCNLKLLATEAERRGLHPALPVLDED